MKKILMLAACTAAMTAITSCSSNDDDVLSQASDAGKAVVDTKCPFNFIVGMDNGTYTRGTQGAEIVEVNDMVEETRASVVSSNPFTIDGAGFNLYGFNGSDMMWTGAKAYARNNQGVWGGFGEWPDTPSGDCYFYALSYAGHNATTITNGNTPTDPTGTSYANVSFNYELPTEGSTSTFDLSKQEDILVAYSVEKDGDNYGTALVGQTSGDVNLNFSHALANLEIKMVYPSDAYDDATQTYVQSKDHTSQFSYFLYVKSITIHNLPISGDYTFGATNPWTPGATMGDIKISYPTGKIFFSTSFQKIAIAESVDLGSFLGNPTDRRTFERQHYEDILAGNTSVMVIPNQITPWATGAVDPDNHTYIEINGAVLAYGGRADTSLPLDDTEKETIIATIAEAQGSEGTWVLENNDFESLGFIDTEAAIEGKTNYEGESYFIKIPSMSFLPNHRYVFYITVTTANMLDNAGAAAISDIN